MWQSHGWVLGLTFVLVLSGCVSSGNSSIGDQDRISHQTQYIRERRRETDSWIAEWHFSTIRELSRIPWLARLHSYGQYRGMELHPYEC